MPRTRIFQDWVTVASSPPAGSSWSCNQISCSLVTAGPATAANGPQRLGLRDNQVSGDLKSCNEGTQLNLLAGARRQSVLNVCHFG